jgi:hypothetical protein
MADIPHGQKMQSAVAAWRDKDWQKWHFCAWEEGNDER